MNSTSQISSKTEQFKDTKSLQALNEFAKKIKVASDEAKGANVDTVALTTDPLKKAVPLLYHRQ